MQISGAKALVTGGASGMGRHFVLSLAKAGADVAFCDLNTDAIAEVEAEGADLPGTVKGFEANVADEESVGNLINNAHDALGGLNVLVNNAGIFRDGLLVKKDKETGAIKKMSLRKWQSVIDVDLTGPFLCTRDFAAKCIETGVQNPGHPTITTVGAVAADPEAYETFKEFFDPVISMRHNGYAPDAVHPSDLDYSKLHEFAPNEQDAARIRSTRIRSGRSLAGIPLPPACTKEQRREVEKQVVKGLMTLEGDLKGDYYPLAGSNSYEPKPGGMTAEQEEQLRVDHFLFQEPDSTLLISGKMHRDWPDARGIWHNALKNALVWTNEEDHMRVISMQMDGDLQEKDIHLYAPIPFYLSHHFLIPCMLQQVWT